MLNIKRIDHVLNTTVYSMTNTVPLIHLVRHRQLKFLGHILRMSKEEPARRYALYIPTIGKRRPGRPRTSYLNYVQRLLGDNEGAMQEQQIAAFADDRCSWRNLVVACSTADGWWWWWWRRVTKILLRHFRPGGGALTWKGGAAFMMCSPQDTLFTPVTTCPFTKPSFERKMRHFPPKVNFFFFFLDNRPMTIFSSRSSNLTAIDFRQRNSAKYQF